ncbi:uncharacterized protein BDR25DRAFT_339892 [Lindgomyces ingoldianus]|uniref:Uncharacterized protein n=1 Tax=Lindgomyces ingoldianus TaxID=673940 RepID=A0ACB6R9Q5_9PLEO|nr:uncharacterized protein BDR25DRAFT_339892 [Lindgomyces ingoldianus]KAF2475994.1 hypothetical protein BDR25DRAFT_339892 [Lindgomyces ingoldianus]
MMSPGRQGSFHDAVLTPPASSVTTSHHPSPLPRPRQHPLKPGGVKESSLISYLDQTVKAVKRRWAKRMFKDEELGQGDVKGYHHFREAAKDIEDLVDVIWVSGSPNLQTPYLLTIALMITDFLPGFPPSPRITFRLLDKMDHAFSSLLQGKDSDTGDILPGFENGRKLSTTDKVRLKSLVERTRLTVVDVLGDDNADGEKEDESMGEGTDGEDTVKFEGFGNEDEDEDEWEEMEIAKVYERTIGELGDVLGGPPIGIITDD